MSEFILYATKKDADAIRTWINAEPEVTWLIKCGAVGNRVEWKAVKTLDALAEQEYALWHVESGPLNIPSGDPHVADTIVVDPFSGWSQTLKRTGATAPWFGVNLPGPYLFRFAELGREAPGSLARSGFFWSANRYKSIGKPAHPDAMRWWRRLGRFLAKSSVQVPWPDSSFPKQVPSYIFPDALFQTKEGRHRDVNL